MVADSLTSWAERTPARPALVFDGITTSFAQLEAMANRLAHGLLSLGIAPGDRVVWCGANSPAVWTVLHASRKAMFVSVPASYRLTAHEISHILATSEARCVLVDADRLGSVLDAVARVGSDALVIEMPSGNLSIGDSVGRRADRVDGAVGRTIRWDDVMAAGRPEPVELEGGTSMGPTMMFTSGTTGLPKGAVRRALAASASGVIMEALGFVPGAEVHLCVGPLYHAGPMRFSSIAQSVGGTVVLSSRFDADGWLDLVESAGVNSAFLAATMLKQVLRSPAAAMGGRDLSALRVLVLGAGPTPMSTKREAIKFFGPIVVEMYGSTETGTNTLLAADDVLRKPGSCGRALPGNELRILDADGHEVPAGEVGELFVRSPMVVDGYVGEARLNQIDGFTSVGDIAFVDDEGFLHLVDRRSDTIISGGVNIYPAEVEAALQGHPDIADVVVLGIPSEQWGESVHAIVQPTPGSTIDTAQVEAWVREFLAGYKVPRSWELRSELPRNDVGKLRKSELRKQYWTDGAAADIATA